jgi:hypothetical protein
VVSEPFDSTMATIRRNMQFQEGRYDRMHILEKGRNQNRYSEERTRDKMKRILTGGSNNIVMMKEGLAEGTGRINGK